MTQDQNKPTQVSDSELDVLKALWTHGKLKVAQLREILEAEGRSWAYNTVQTLLTRLEGKGMVGSFKEGRAFVFFPQLSQNEYLSSSINTLADRVCMGSKTPVMMALVQNETFTKEEIASFRNLLDQLEADES